MGTFSIYRDRRFESRINRIAVFRDPGSAVSPNKETASALADRARSIIMLRSKAGPHLVGTFSIYRDRRFESRINRIAVFRDPG